MIAAAFIILALALMVAVQRSHAVGIQGVFLIGVIMAGAAVIGCMIRCCCGISEFQEHQAPIFGRGQENDD